MPYVVTLVILLGVLCLLNLALTVGVIRRLRKHSEALADRSDDGHGRQAILPEGAVAPPYDTVATDGSTVSRDLITQPVLVGVFSPGCDACHKAMPDFLASAERFPGGPEQVLAVIVDQKGESGPLRAELEPVARVVVEEMGGPVTSALQVQAFPVFALVGGDGRIMASGLRLNQVFSFARA
ncbi:TlpA family protein disulfide reductase [Nonomuraea sp. NPDC049480]|uniref:TlpA family protein disulfide reductase n=1 Tax=Nonomuraea sp. NPDC049480 TaxID=3364353 RepID=UPI0037B67650